MLSPYRVLDLCDERGILCGQILADLGAEVIAVEPPAGSAARNRGPFAGEKATNKAGEKPHSEQSLTWWAYSRGKRSIALDIARADERARFLELVRSADFLIESYDPGYMASLGLGYEELARENPGLIYVSISAFGQDGPKAGYAATDLIVSAAAGISTYFGDEDRAPLRIGVPQAFHHAAAEAAGAALVALFERHRSERGQHVDVSAQQAFALASEGSVLGAPNNAVGYIRMRGGAYYAGLYAPMVWEARDGFVSFFLYFGESFGPFSRRFMEWVHEEGGCDQATRDKDWIGYDALLASGEESQKEYHRVLRVIADFIKTKTKAELLAAALERRLLLAPMQTFSELLESDQFSDRDYWRDIQHPAYDRPARHPGAFARFSETPIENWRPAPALGEYAAEDDRRPARPVSKAPRETSERPLAGLKVLDLTWAIAAPAATRVLADYGATVIKVETASRPDALRSAGMYADGQPDPESSILYHNTDAGKLGLSLDLSQASGREVLTDLVRWADVVSESFSSRVMRKWGFDYESLRKLNPRIVMLSSSLFGQSGPLTALAGFGNMGAAVGGFNSVTGWPDREPAVVLAYTDFAAPRYTVAAILAALDHRERSGEGQYIDLSQAEVAVQLLAPAILDYAINGREAGRIGNRDPEMSPHGTYPAEGENRWVAIAVADDEQWRALCECIGQPELADAARYADVEGRLAHADELDQLLAKWTREQSAEAIESQLQGRGVPAHTVLDSAGFANDSQLLHRKHLIRLERPGRPAMTIEGSRAQLSRTPARVDRAAPTFGRDTKVVLSEILGYSEERVAELEGLGALT